MLEPRSKHRELVHVAHSNKSSSNKYRTSDGSLSRLEDELANLGTKVMDIERNTIDNGKTNYSRISYALSLEPVIRRGGKKFYRTFSLTNDGLICIGYSQNMPEFLVALSSDEKISQELAAQYLGITYMDIRKLILDGEIEAMKRTVNLDSLNYYKFKTKE